MLRFILRETDEYDRLVQFMTKFGLEFDGEDKVGNKVLRCWKVIQEPDHLTGGIILSERQGEYILNGIAVDTPMRKSGIGKIMVNKLVTEVRKREGKRIYLAAKAPEFFEKVGFVEVKGHEADHLFTCRQCGQNGSTSMPRIMKMEL
jgi:N-acetylglutamate synthase-like GNAT family acetyltransferase